MSFHDKIDIELTHTAIKYHYIINEAISLSSGLVRTAIMQGPPKKDVFPIACSTKLR